jgi:hypothetical protein
MGNNTKETFMKRNILALFLIGLFFLPSLACGTLRTEFVEGSGNIITQSFMVDSFDRVTLEGSGNVHIKQGQTESLSVETDDNILRLLEIRVRGNELILGTKRGFDINPSQPVVYNLTVKDLGAITLAGSGSFDIEPLQLKDLQISLPGSGDIKIESLSAKELSIDLNGSGNIALDDLNVKTLDTSLHGSGDIELQGIVKEEKVVVRGSGNYWAGDLQAKSVKVSIPGSADVVVWVINDLEVRVDGSGTIQYYGDPVIEQRGRGSGELTPLSGK